MQSTYARQDLDYPNGMGSADNGVHNIFWSAWLYLQIPKSFCEISAMPGSQTFQETGWQSTKQLWMS